MSANALLNLEPGFAQPVTGAQAVFRGLLEAMARPGRVQVLPATALRHIGQPLDRHAEPIGSGLAGLLLTLLDADTTVAWHGRLGSGAARAWLRFHTGAREAEPAHAQFSVVHADDLQPAHWLDLPLGSDEDPHRGATLIVAAPCLRADAAADALARPIQLRGPGIEQVQPLAADVLPSAFWSHRQAMQAQFPRGFETVLVNGPWVAALPRSTCLSWEA